MSKHYLQYWLRASQIRTASSYSFKPILSSFSSIKDLFDATQDEWRAKGLGGAIYRALHATSEEVAEGCMRWGEEAGNGLIAYDDPRYPSLLKEIYDPPLVLYVQGDPELLAHPQQMAMVGSRAATTQGVNTAKQFAGALAKAGWVITSGLAKGIDAASHQGALDGGGLTVAVCATGLRHVYPKSHQSLRDRILAERGALVSELSPDTPAHAKWFPRRNRLISGLSVGVLVVEAALQSGSLITAKAALEQGRNVFAMPGSIHNPLSKGCHALLKDGATLVESVADIVNEWSAYHAIPAPVSSGHRSQNHQPLSSQAQAVLAVMEYEITPIDVILLRCGLTLSELSSILLILELEGYIQSVSGGYSRSTF